MKGIAEHDLRAERLEFLGRHRLDRAVGADRHEGRRVDHAARQVQAPEARGAVGAQQLEAQLLQCSRCRLPAMTRAGNTSMASP